MKPITRDPLKLSIIIPVFNEEKTIKTVLENINALTLPKVEKEIIIIDDGSSDATPKIIQNQIGKMVNTKFFIHKINQGKGAAVRTGISHATGNFIVIQDADLEYNPADIGKMLKQVLENGSQVVYGTRLKRLPNFSKDERTTQFFLHYIGNKFLSLLTSFLYGQWITDMETCYKLFPKTAVSDMHIRARGFEFEPEITAKLLKKGFKINEIPISTNPRGVDQGKKLNTVKDGTKALISLLKYRVYD